MRLFVLSLLVALGATAGAAQAAEPHGPCTVGFLPRGRAPEAIYLCTSWPLKCRDNWFVAGADSAANRLSRYACRADVTRMAGQVGATPATCAEGFHPNPAAVRDGQSYDCEATHPIIAPVCSSEYLPGGLMLAGKPLAEADSPAAATRRRLDGNPVTYVCVKQ